MMYGTKMTWDYLRRRSMMVRYHWEMIIEMFLIRMAIILIHDVCLCYNHMVLKRIETLMHLNV